MSVPLIVETVLKKCELPRPMDEVLTLEGLLFDQWPQHMTEAWDWLGHNVKGHATHDGQQWRRTRAQFSWKGKRLSPALVLWQFFTGRSLLPNEKLMFKYRGARELERDNMNPCFYYVSKPRAVTRKPQSARPRVIQGLCQLMTDSNFFPSSVEELLERWPEMADTPEANLEATINAMSLT